MGIYKDLNDYELMYMVEENDDAKDLLFEKYRPIILNIASYYKNEGKRYGLDLDDLIQEGYLGLYSAVKSFNSDNGNLFYTYAVLSIRSKILNVIKNCSAKKHSLLNNSFSFYESICHSDTDILLEHLKDEKSVLPEQILLENELSNLIFGFLYSLDIDHAIVLELRINGFSNNDIGILIDKSSKQVTNAIFRINKKLKNHLTKNYRLLSN